MRRSLASHREGAVCPGLRCPASRQEERLQERGMYLHLLLWHSACRYECLREAAPSISMQKPTRQIKPSGGERMTDLPFEDGIGVVEDDVGGIHSMASCCLMEEW